MTLLADVKKITGKSELSMADVKTLLTLYWNYCENITGII
jgi:hypothetical protein